MKKERGCYEMDMEQKTCPNCGNIIENGKLKSHKHICPSCGHYFRIGAYRRIEMVTDKGSFQELYEDVVSDNPLRTVGYEEKLSKASEKSGLKESVVVGTARIYHEPVVIAVCDADFLMGSIGYALGEKITRGIELATKERLPMFVFCCSGGARMQEGIISLMQIEKMAAAIRRHGDEKLLYATILTDPTTGGATASFGTLGDVIMAEPGAMIGFTGPRVIEQTTGVKLPEGFQRAEFQEEHGMIDGIVERKRLKKMLQYLILATKGKQGYDNFSGTARKDFKSLMLYMRSKMNKKLSPWEKVKTVREAARPATMDYVLNIFDVFVELKGDRFYGDDGAVVGGIAMLDGQPVTVIATYRGKDVNELTKRNFGMPMPEGYRKSMRLMKLAEKFNMPIITFINTSGANCGPSAEERGQGNAIAQNLYGMSGLRVPTLAIITGEAGSGGAMALASGNQVWMLENSTYSIISPEGYASILWKDSSRAEEAAANMHLTAQDLSRLGIIDKIIPEMGEYTEENLMNTASLIRVEIIKYLCEMSKKTPDQIEGERYERFRKY